MRLIKGFAYSKGQKALIQGNRAARFALFALIFGVFFVNTMLRSGGLAFELTGMRGGAVVAIPVTIGGLLQFWLVGLVVAGLVEVTDLEKLFIGLLITASIVVDSFFFVAPTALAVAAINAGLPRYVAVLYAVAHVIQVLIPFFRPDQTERPEVRVGHLERELAEARAQVAALADTPKAAPAEAAFHDNGSEALARPKVRR
jgi:hypothetical protein